MKISTPQSQKDAGRRASFWGVMSGPQKDAGVFLGRASFWGVTGANEPTGLSGEDMNTSDGETESQSTDDAVGEHQLGTVLSALGEDQKRELLDQTRNIRIRKTMCMAKGGKKTLLAESEDCLLVFDCEMLETRLFDVKHEAASDDLRQDMLALQKGQQVSRVRFKEEIEQITKGLHDYVSEIRKCHESGK